MSEFVGNKAKRRISKRVFQENKARQIFLPPDTYTYSLLRKNAFAESWDKDMIRFT